MKTSQTTLTDLVQKIWVEYTPEMMINFGQFCLGNYTQFFKEENTDSRQIIEYLGIILLAVSDVKDDHFPTSENPLYQETYKLAQELKSCV